MKRAVILLAFVAIAACGRVQTLRQPPAPDAPPGTVGPVADPTPQNPQARPARIDDVLRRSDTRAPDPFDLPPPGV